MPGRIGPEIPNDIKNAFGPQLKRLRIARNMAANEMIAKLGVQGWHIGASTFSALEAGKRILADTELLLILKVLEADLTDLSQFDAFRHIGLQN